MSGSTPDAESEGALEWKNFGEVKFSAISDEPIGLPFKLTMFPFAIVGIASCPMTSRLSGYAMPVRTSMRITTLIAGAKISQYLFCFASYFHLINAESTRSMPFIATNGNTIPPSP